MVERRRGGEGLDGVVIAVVQGVVMVVVGGRSVRWVEEKIVGKEIGVDGCGVRSSRGGERDGPLAIRSGGVASSGAGVCGW